MKPSLANRSKPILLEFDNTWPRCLIVDLKNAVLICIASMHHIDNQKCFSPHISAEIVLIGLILLVIIIHCNA